MSASDLVKFVMQWGPGVYVFWLAFKLVVHWINASRQLKLAQTKQVVELGKNCLKTLLSAQREQSEAFHRLATAIELGESRKSLERLELLKEIKALRLRATPETSCQPSGTDRLAEDSPEITPPSDAKVSRQ